MIEDVFVINPTVHAYNLRDDNVQPNPWAEGLKRELWNLHRKWNPSYAQVPENIFTNDCSMEVLTRTLFLETSVDIAGNMNLRLDSWFKDGLCSREKNVEAATRWPDRYVTYVGVDPTAGLDVCLADLKDQMDELPSSVGLKLYPDRVAPFDSWRMDDHELAYPLFEAAQELGIRTIAIHKAVPNGPVPLAPYKVDDIDGAAIHFPELSFEIIHAGLSFIDETALALRRFPNVYANLEITSMLLHRAPGWFAEIIAYFMFWGGAEKVIYSDGCIAGHSQPLLDKFWEIKFSDALLEKYGLEQITKEDKRKILGANYAQIIGLDVDHAREKIAEDEFSRAQREHGLDAPFSNWLTAAKADGMHVPEDLR